MASEGDEKCPRDLTSVEKIFFKNGRNPTWISANISNSYVLNKFSLWFEGVRGPERENRPKSPSAAFSHHVVSMDNQNFGSAQIVQKNKRPNSAKMLKKLSRD